jgi:hypothetical protein
MGGPLLYHQRVRIEPGDNSFLLEVLSMPGGTYIVRLENALTGAAKVAKMSVAR